MVHNMLRNVGNLASVRGTTDVEVKIFYAALGYPRAPTGSEIKNIFPPLEGNWDFTSEIRSIPFVREGYFVDHTPTFAKAIAFLPTARSHDRPYSCLGPLEGSR